MPSATFYSLPSFEGYTVTLLEHAGEYLLLQRAGSKLFAPHRWTGIGGKIEPHETADIRASALRELHEESGISEQDITAFAMRRVLVVPRPNRPLVLIWYFTGRLLEKVTPPCNEGTLCWVIPKDMAQLDVIETTRPALMGLIRDIERDPEGSESGITIGAAHFDKNAMMSHVRWLDDDD